MPIWQLNEHYVLKFTRNLESFTKEKYSFGIFNLKDKANHVSYIVHEGKCICGETGPNVTIRWDEHSDIVT